LGLDGVWSGGSTGLKDELQVIEVGDCPRKRGNFEGGYGRSIVTNGEFVE